MPITCSAARSSQPRRLVGVFPQASSASLSNPCILLSATPLHPITRPSQRCTTLLQCSTRADEIKNLGRIFSPGGRISTLGATEMAMAMLVWASMLLFTFGAAASDVGGTIGFSTLGRLSFDFEVYTLTLPKSVEDRDLEETRVTFGETVSYNAQLVEAQWGSAIVERLQSHGHSLLQGSEPLELLLYVSEVEGSPQLYLDIPLQANGVKRKRPISLRESDRMNGGPKAFLNDRPSMHGDRIIFISTEEDIGIRVQSWNAVFSLNFKTSVTKRLTPPGITDFSPAVSPSGEWVAVASNQGRGWLREIEALNLDLYVFKAEDGSQRRMVVKNAGWPTWADESTVYFHRLAEDGWWSIFKVNVSDTSADQEAERVTPPGAHAFTPAASRCGKWIAVATHRASIRHIEIFDLQTKNFIPLTAPIHPNTHHYNPFVSPNSNKIGYHRCRGIDQDTEILNPRMEYQKSPIAGVSLYRIGGSFPVISPDGSLVAFVNSGNNSAGLAVMNFDGSQKREVYQGSVFGTNWDPTGKGTVYAAQGAVFKGVKTPVHIVAIQNADNANGTYKFLTKKGTGNNAFPSASPDGKYVVFRSGRSGHKNLYIMDAEGGEEKYLRRLTDGHWRDTMPAWSPDNEWIAFSSNRLHPTGERSFSLYLIRPNGTDLHVLLYTGIGGLAMHPAFSPDGKKIAFASNYAGVSAEPIAHPHAYQPYGTIFVINVDGSGLTRMTHNAYEDGTPSWGRLTLSKSDISKEGDQTACDFDDVWFLNDPSAAKVRSGLCQRRWDLNLLSSAHITGSFLQM